MSKDHQELDIELEQFMQANGWEYKPNKGGTFYWQQFNGIYKSQMGISEARQLLIHCKSLITLEVEKALEREVGHWVTESNLDYELFNMRISKRFKHLRKSINNKKENV